MKIDMVDIGGAAAMGRPRIGNIQTIVMDESGFSHVADNQGNIISNSMNADLLEVKYAETTKAVESSLHPGAKAAYPDVHPANRSDIARSPNGALIPDKGQALCQQPEALGDVRRGYVTGPINAPSNVQPQPVVGTATPAYGYGQMPMLNKPASGDMNFAKDEAGEALIEVVYHTDIGAIATYYHRVEETGKWLILIVDNTKAAKQRFIPKPGRDSIELTITGKDKKENTLHVISLGIQFTIANYDFMVMMIDHEASERSEE